MSSSWNVEVASPVSAARLFKAFHDWHKLGPKLLPEIIVSVEGESTEIGSVRKLNFTPALPFSYVKERLDFVDADKFEVKTTLVEGGHLGTKLESASTHFKLEPTSSGGSVYKVVATFKPIGADEGEEAKAKEAVIGQFKAVEAYLLANPTAYA